MIKHSTAKCIASTGGIVLSSSYQHVFEGSNEYSLTHLTRFIFNVVGVVVVVVVGGGGGGGGGGGCVVLLLMLILLPSPPPPQDNAFRMRWREGTTPSYMNKSE